MNLCKTCSILVPRQCNGNSIILRRQEKVAQNAEMAPRNAKDVICVRVCRTFGPCHANRMCAGREWEGGRWTTFWHRVPLLFHSAAPYLETSNVRCRCYLWLLNGTGTEIHHHWSLFIGLGRVDVQCYIWIWLKQWFSFFTSEQRRRTGTGCGWFGLLAGSLTLL